MADTSSKAEFWLPITVRVAWELHTAGFRVRSSILRGAREHVLRSLPSDLSVPHAERLATVYAHDFIDRFQHHRYRRPEIDSDLYMDIPLGWKRNLQSRLKSIGKVVFRFHYTDGFALDIVSVKGGMSVPKLEKGRDRLRSLLRIILAGEGIDITDWEEPRIDRLLGRIANLSGPQTFAPEDILNPEKKKEIRQCPCMSKAYRLLRYGSLSLNDLKPDLEGVEDSRQSILTLLLHPDARQHSLLLSKALSPFASTVCGDAWFVPSDYLGDLEERLGILSESNTPPRHHLRGSLVHGPGRWFDGILLGPLPIRSLEAARSRPWGEIDGIDSLPPPLPPPPRVLPWWLGAVGTASMGIASLLWIFSLPHAAPAYPLEMDFKVSPDTVWSRFDVDDRAYLDVLSLKDGNLGVVHHSLFTDKGLLATGDGRYFFQDDAEQIAVISAATPVEALEALVQVAQGEPDPFAYLTEQIHAKDPTADIEVSPLYSPPSIAYRLTRLQD